MITQASKWLPCTKTYPKYTRSDLAPVFKSLAQAAVFDSETSGLPVGRKKVANPEIVEMSIVAIETGEILFNSLFRPKDMDAYIESEAREMHAYPIEDYENTPTFPDRWDEIKRIFQRYHPIAYNTDFDWPMLIRTAHMYGLSVPRMKATCAMEMFKIYMCTESCMAENAYKLSAACEIMGINQEEYGTPHTALADALATRELLVRMRDEVHNE